MDTIGERVRYWRAVRTMTMKDLAAAAGTTHSYISQLEAGKISPTVDMLVRIAEAMNVTLTDLAGNGPATDGSISVEQLAREIYDSYFSESDLPYADVRQMVMDFLALREKPEILRVVAVQLHALQREREAGARDERRRIEAERKSAERGDEGGANEAQSPAGSAAEDGIADAGPGGAEGGGA